MTTPLTTIRNIGPAMADAFRRAGIDTAEDIHALGPDAAYCKLLDHGHPPHFIGYYAMVMGLQGRPWNDCKGSEKAELRVRFDAIKSRTTAPVGIEAILDAIGTGARR